VDEDDCARPAQSGKFWEATKGREADQSQTSRSAKASSGPPQNEPCHQSWETGKKPMIEDFQTVLAESDRDRLDLFVGAAARLRTDAKNIEKDF
jgi:hypothetical protein